MLSKYCNKMRCLNKKERRKKKKVSDMFFSIPFLILEILKKCVQRRVTIPQGEQHVYPFNKVKPCSARLVLGWATRYEYPVLQ